MSKATKKTTARKILIRVLVVIALVLVAVNGYLGYNIWCDTREVFHDVTVELGTETLGIRDFMTELAKPGRVHFVSDPGSIDLNRVGTTEVTLQHGSQTYTQRLTIVDTTPPMADIDREKSVDVSAPLPAAKELVHNLKDESEVRCFYAEEPVIPGDYSPITVTVVAEDASGNTLRQESTFTFYGWLKDTCTLEFGQKLSPEMILNDPEKDAALLSQDQLDEASASVGDHIITATTGSSEAVCVVSVVDTTPPALQVQNVRRKPGEDISLSDFVVSSSDLSALQLRVVGDEPSADQNGQFTVTIEAVDASGNVTTKEATLWVSNNLNPPKIKGADKALTIEKHSENDFLKGVTATDDMDGKCEVTVDLSSLDTSKAGTYFITYASVDSSGNVGTVKRKVTVKPNQEDTLEMVKALAATLPDDPEAIRDYVRNGIAYSSNWGGDDPVWYGLTNHTGNCYVHANTLKALLDEKGYETQLIWVTNKSHYWLVIKLDEGWRHIDSTPSYQHRKISLMTDKERYLNLNGRNWDRSKWPACN